MSGRGRNLVPVVSREYRPEPESCARALEFLLKEPLMKEGRPTTSCRDAVVSYKQGVSRVKQ